VRIGGTTPRPAATSLTNPRQWVPVTDEVMSSMNGTHDLGLGLPEPMTSGTNVMAWPSIGGTVDVPGPGGCAHEVPP
jgi:hypothetical protein